MAVACTVCEIHAESIFKIEGMDCHEEVAILEKRLKQFAARWIFMAQRFGDGSGRWMILKVPLN